MFSIAGNKFPISLQQKNGFFPLEFICYLEQKRILKILNIDFDNTNGQIGFELFIDDKDLTRIESQNANKKKSKDIYMFKELKIDLEDKLLINSKKNKKKRIKGFNHKLINFLIKNTKFYSWDELLSTDMLKTLDLPENCTTKDLNDRKCKFESWLQNNLEISKETATSLIITNEGLRINSDIRKIDE